MKIFIILSVGAFVFYWIFSRWHNAACPWWLGWLVELDNPFSRINRAENIIKNADLHKGMIVLDAGCGPGRITVPAALAVGIEGKVIALDIQETMLEKVKNKVSEQRISQVSFFRAGLGENKLPENFFDRILLVTVLGEIPDQKVALKEIFSSLKPGGILSITETVFDPHFQRVKHVRLLTGDIGFEEREVFEDFFSFTLNVRKAV